MIAPIFVVRMGCLKKDWFSVPLVVEDMTAGEWWLMKLFHELSESCSSYLRIHVSLPQHNSDMAKCPSSTDSIYVPPLMCVCVERGRVVDASQH